MTHEKIQQQLDEIARQKKELIQKRSDTPIKIKYRGFSILWNMMTSRGRRYGSYIAKRYNPEKVIKLGTRYDTDEFERRIDKFLETYN